MNSKVTISDLFQAKQNGSRISAVSCYDYTTARLLSQTDVDMLLVGDSSAQVTLGHDSTLPATMDFMVAITAGVARGAPNALIVADMPFLSYQLTMADAIKNAGRFLTEGNAQMVKIEAGQADLPVIKAVSDAGIAVMAHIGLKPQTISKMGRFKAEATTAQMARGLIDLADRMVQAGAASLLIEATAAEVAGIITKKVPVPVISCGSGPDCDGQILIAPDILGLTQGKLPKFAKSFGQLAQPTTKAFQDYSDQIKAGKFPDHAHSYHMQQGQLRKLKEDLA